MEYGELYMMGEAGTIMTPLLFADNLDTNVNLKHQSSACTLTYWSYYRWHVLLKIHACMSLKFHNVPLCFLSQWLLPIAVDYLEMDQGLFSMPILTVLGMRPHYRNVEPHNLSPLELCTSVMLE